jgi:hypothetical protein
MGSTSPQKTLSLTYVMANLFTVYFFRKIDPIAVAKIAVNKNMVTASSGTVGDGEGLFN